MKKNKKKRGLIKGKAKFYADENIEYYLVDYLRSLGYSVDYACELGFHSRDDQFHFYETKRRKRILLTHDRDFLDHRLFPFSDLNNSAIIILSSEYKSSNSPNFGYALVGLIDQIANSGNQNLYGLKIEIKGPHIRLFARVKGEIRSDEIDITKPILDRQLFQD